jgi:hypothetical protein
MDTAFSEEQELLRAGAGKSMSHAKIRRDVDELIRSGFAGAAWQRERVARLPIA